MRDTEGMERVSKDGAFVRMLNRLLTRIAAKARLYALKRRAVSHPLRRRRMKLQITLGGSGIALFKIEVWSCGT